MISWCRWLRITQLLAQSLGLIHPQSASTGFVPSVHQFAQESSIVYLRASEKFMWSRATSQTVITFVFREVHPYCGARTRAELVEVVHPALEVPNPWCLRSLALCEIWLFPDEVREKRTHPKLKKIRKG